MPAPIMPAPSRPSLPTLARSTPAGREAPFLMALSWNHSVWIMLRASRLITQAAK
jgi:hypothetical protein